MVMIDIIFKGVFSIMVVYIFFAQPYKKNS